MVLEHHTTYPQSLHYGMDPACVAYEVAGDVDGDGDGCIGLMDYAAAQVTLRTCADRNRFAMNVGVFYCEDTGR